MKSFKVSLLGAALVGLSACATGPQLATAGVYDAGSYSVNLASDWNVITVRTGKNKKAHLLTLDGPLLNSVYLFDNIMPGDSLLKERRKENPVPKFASDMFDLELIEFVTDSLQKGGGVVGLQTRNVRPDTFNGEDAIRFEFTGVTSAGLNMSGEALFAVVDETLDLILFLAPTELYAEKDRANIDAIFNSVADGMMTG